MGESKEAIAKKGTMETTFSSDLAPQLTGKNLSQRHPVKSLDHFDVVNNNHLQTSSNKTVDFEEFPSRLLRGVLRDGNGDEKFSNKLAKTPAKVKGNLGAKSSVPKLVPIRLPNVKDLGTKIKAKKEPLPMKLRALPRSFWQQPNQPAALSPAPAPPPLAPISSQRDEDSQASTGECSEEASAPTVMSDANTELLFSLFHTVENKRRSAPIKRGRPRKLSSRSPPRGPRDDDPCLVGAGLLPSLGAAPPQPDYPKPPNYARLLSELVYQL